MRQNKIVGDDSPVNSNPSLSQLSQRRGSLHPEVVAGFPDRIVPVNEEAAEKLKKRTLTQLYNERPAWLDHAHKALDAAVAAAYGWPENITEEEALKRLLALNLERSA